MQLWSNVLAVWLKCRWPIVAALVGWMFAQGHARAQQQPDPASELRRQQERTHDQQRRLESGVDVRSGVPQTDGARLAQGETPCYVINHIELRVEHQNNDRPHFDWLTNSLTGPLHDDSPLGRCLGGKGIGVILKRAQEAVIAKGFVTTRVLAQPQDLTTGTLILTVIPGRVSTIRLVDAGTPTVRSTVPIKAGDILNLRDIEQGLENFKRVPTATADIQIEPAKTAGPDQSVLLITYAQSAPARLTTTLDDSGSKGTGKFQGGTTLSLDNPLGLSDLFYLTLNHDLNTELGPELGNTLHGDRGTRGYSVHYSLPVGYWTVGADHSSNRYYQKVAGLNQDYLYSGTSENNDITLSRLVYRDAVRKTSTSLKAWQRESNNFIDDTEVLNQRRSVGGFELRLNHKDVWGDAKLEGSVAYKRGTQDFDSIPAPEEAFHEGTSKFGLLTLDASITTPFKFQGKNFTHSGSLRVQDNATSLTPQDRFSIGSRYSVRGFDGESSLVGERGWTLRNEFSTALEDTGNSVYLGVDTGEVSGPSTQFLLGTTLSGAVIGLRGAVKKLQYDVFVGTPLYKPAGFKTADTTAGFNLTWSL